MKAAILKLAAAGAVACGWAGRCAADGERLDPIVPFVYQACGVEKGIAELRQIREATGLRRFFLCAPGFNDVMYAPFSPDLYAKIGRDVAAFKAALAETDIEISWWCSPSIRYVSDFPSIEDPSGHRSADNKKCPLDPAFAADWAGKVAAVAQAHPRIICIEDDYTLSWGRGLDGHGACWCRRHMESFAAHYGKALTAKEVAAAFERATEENLPIRRAFADTVRDSLVSLARKVREEVDKVDPSIRIILCESAANSDKDGNALEPVARAFAGRTRPAVRPSGAIYGAETTPADIPGAMAHTVWTLEHLSPDVETFYEADTYPHNRFYSSAAQLLSLMAGALMAGSDDYLFYCLQYLDDPLEDRGYADAYNACRPRLEAVRRFIREKNAHLVGVREVWTPDALSLRRGFGPGMGAEVLSASSYMLGKLGLPYTTRKGASPCLLVGGVAAVLDDAELREILSGGVLLDAPAAEIVTQRGFGDLLGVGVEHLDKLPALGEEILPPAGLARKGRKLNAYYILSAGSEGTVRSFARLSPREGTEVWSKFTGLGGTDLAPSITVATNALGGRVAVMATSLVGNRTSGLYNLRKQELYRRLFARLSPDGVPVAADGVPGIWLMTQVSADGREMLLMVDNLSGDVREGVDLAFAPSWCGAAVSRLNERGEESALDKTSASWRLPLTLGSMCPEFLLLRR